jgi:hypothetical protein
MATFCITSSNPEFQKLAAESGKKQGVFAMMVSKWMTQNEIYDRYPTLQELGITTAESVKPGVEELFNDNPELASIGTQEQYSQYLDSVFPDSQVKDIVYHTNTQSRIEFGTRGEKGLFVTPTWELAKTYKPGPYGKRFQLLINSNNILKLPELELMKGLKKGNEDTQKYSEEDYTEYVVFKPEQIHILGNKQDVEGFKEFVGNVEDKASESGLSLSTDEAVAYNSLVSNGTIPIKCK